MIMTEHKFGYIEDMLQTRFIEGIKEKQESREKLTYSE